MTLTEFAPAKVNLSLHVTGQREDGYHQLDSLIAFASVGDQLEAEPAAAFSLRVAGPFGAGLSPGEDNLILRAARLEAPDFPLAFRLVKNLPLASGIGGGSSDAAAAIRLSRRARGLAALPPDPAAFAALGADVPVCLAPGAQRMRGIGEVLSPLPALPKASVLLINPGVGVATPAVFRALACKDNPAMPEDLPVWRDAGALARFLQAQRNDLEEPARRLAPVIGEVLAALGAQPDLMIARMSGSGATCFGLFASEAAAQKAAAAIGARHPGWWQAVAALL